MGLCKLKHEGTFWEETKLFNMCFCSKCYFCNCCSKQFCVLHDSCTWQELITVFLLSHMFKRRRLFLEFSVGLLFSQAAELTSVLAIACMIILFQTEGVCAYLCSTAWENRGIAGHTHLHPGLNTVGCLISPHVGCLVSHFLGRELEENKEYFYQHVLCVLKLRLYYCQKDC